MMNWHEINAAVNCIQPPVSVSTTPLIRRTFTPSFTVSCSILPSCNPRMAVSRQDHTASKHNHRTQLTHISPAPRKLISTLQSDLISTITQTTTSASLATVLHANSTPSTTTTTPQHQKKKQNTYNSRDSLVVTHPTTDLPIWCLSMAERTGCPVLISLWSYVEVLPLAAL